MQQAVAISCAAQSQKQAEYTAQRRQYWNEFAAASERWNERRRSYQQRLTEVYRFLIPPGMRVLELGCGQGDLLAAVQPDVAVGVDFSHSQLDLAKRRHPEARFIGSDVHTLDLGEQFDYVICSDLANDLWDVQAVLERVREHCHERTRLIVNSYNRLWEQPRKLLEKAGFLKPQLTQNWLLASDLENLLYLAGFEVIRRSEEILDPIGLPGIGGLANRYLVKVWPFSTFAVTNVIVARPRPQEARRRTEPKVSVVVPARNEAGNIDGIFERVPQMGGGTELIFVEGNSTDDTYAAIERAIKANPGVPARLLRQPGKGKGDAVRAGFREATGDVLMILDADMTVPPEDLPRFYEAWRSGRADFVNGVRLVYPMEDKAMRFFNHIGNRFFSLAFSWLLNQNIKDTLCGTKVLSRRDYEMIAANRAYFGEFDPFGDFDLLFGAARYNLKIADLPIRYAERTYGDTNIDRWRHGMILLRMVLYAMRRIKFV